MDPANHDLRAIGFWNGPHTPAGWPDITQFIDPSWDADDREFIAGYLSRGVLGRAYMGYSPCRLCGKKDNGYCELSDGVYVWPEGLVHYVVDHDVRLPQEFVQHAIDLTERLEGERDESWWRTAPRDW